MSDKYILGGEDGKTPIPVADVREWGRAFEKGANRIVGKTQVGSLLVSTVFLGLDHQWGDGPPLLFETMVFDCDDNGHMTSGADLYCDRYSTWAEAEAGHALTVSRVEAGEIRSDNPDEGV